MVLTHVEHGLSGCKIPRWAAGEAFGRLDLALVEHGKQLVTAGLDEAHRCSPCGVHGRALRSIADRLLAVACAMLETRTIFDRDLPAKRTSAAA